MPDSAHRQPARAARHNFLLTEAVQPVVEDICAALDGLPLAIELAAARCDRLTLFEIRSQLTQRFELLTDGPRDAPRRQRSLGEVIDWSWALLNDVEQLLLARLSVFRDGWSTNAAEAVCGFGGIDAGDVRAVTGALVRKSLVVASLDGDQARMRCLRPIIESFRQNELLPPDWSSDSLASWRDHPDAGYVWLREAQRGRDPDAVGRAAFACAENPSMSMHVAVWAHSAAVRIQRMWGRDPSANLAEMRRLAANSDDAHVRLHVAFGEYHASPRPSAEADRSLDDAEVAAEEIGVPSFVGMVGLFKLMGRTDDATVREAHRLRELFLGVGNTFLAAMCGALVDQIRPGTARFAEMLASTRNAFQDSPVWLLSFACGRAEFLASQGRAETAATLLGLPEVAWNCATPLAERAALDHPDAYERGRAMSLDDAARLLLDELESLVEQLESADIVG